MLSFSLSPGWSSGQEEVHELWQLHVCWLTCQSTCLLAGAAQCQLQVVDLPGDQGAGHERLA